MKTLTDLVRGDREELISLISRFLDPSCHTQSEHAVLARELVHSPAVGAVAREVLSQADRLGMRSTADAQDAWRELTQPLLSGFCCEVDAGLVEVLMGPPYRPGLDRPLAWFGRACDDCYRRFIRALKIQRLLCAENAFAAWNEYQEGGALAQAVREMENEEPVRFPDSEAGRAACSEAYQVSREALPKKLEDVKDRSPTAARSVHALAAARLMNAHRYTSDIPAAKEMLLEVERLKPMCAPFHSAEIDALVGVLKADLGQTEEALERLRAAVDAFSEQDQHLAGVWTIQLAEAERSGGRNSFLPTLRMGRILLDPRRDPDIHQIATIDLASALAEMGEPLEALRIIDKVEFSNRFFTAIGTAVTAIIDRSLGDLESAHRKICIAIDEYLALGRSHDVAVCLLLRGEIQQEREFIVKALQDFAAGAAIFEALDCRNFKVTALQELQRALEVGNSAEAAGIARKIREQLSHSRIKP